MLQFNWFRTRRSTPIKVLVLMYHRIADLRRDPWELAVSPANFDAQLALLREQYNVISVPQMLQQLESQNIAANSICLTFDDAYADNYQVAKPLLEKYSCPGTFFVTSKCLINQQPFWWDELETLVFDSPTLPEMFSETIGDRLISIKLGSETHLKDRLQSKQDKWVWPARPVTQRTRLYLLLWEALKPLPIEKLESELGRIKKWAGFDTFERKQALPMTADQLQQMSANPLFDIGLHTLSHPALSNHSYEAQLHEITENKTYLENLCGREINTIAFPYGDYNEQTLQVARQLQLRACFSTKEFSVRSSSDAIDLGRLKVTNWDASTFAKRISSWLKNA